MRQRTRPSNRVLTARPARSHPLRFPVGIRVDNLREPSECSLHTILDARLYEGGLILSLLEQTPNLTPRANYDTCL